MIILFKSCYLVNSKGRGVIRNIVLWMDIFFLSMICTCVYGCTRSIVYGAMRPYHSHFKAVRPCTLSAVS